jgi:hypothetical protein
LNNNKTGGISLGSEKKELSTFEGKILIVGLFQSGEAVPFPFRHFYSLLDFISICNDQNIPETSWKPNVCLQKLKNRW